MKLKLNSVPFCSPEGYGENQPWSISLKDIPEETSSHAKTGAPKPKAKVESPLIANARKRVSESETTNPLIANAKKRAEKAQTEVQKHV